MIRMTDPSSSGQWYQVRFLGFLPEGPSRDWDAASRLSVLRSARENLGFLHAEDLSIDPVSRPRIEIERKLPADKEERVALIGVFIDQLITVLRCEEATEDLIRRVHHRLLYGSPLGDELIDAETMATPVARIPLADLEFLPEQLRVQAAQAVAQDLKMFSASDGEGFSIPGPDGQQR